MSWFTEMKIPNKKNRWKSLYDDVHRRSPEAVFNYLRQENLWGEGE